MCPPARRWNVTPVDDGRRGGELFVVVLDGHSSSRETAVMCRALRSAVSRLAAGGAPIHWCGAVVLTDVCRCLCLLQAADRSDVVLARDVAALPSAAVHPAHPLTDAPVSRPSRSEGRS